MNKRFSLAAVAALAVLAACPVSAVAQVQWLTSIDQAKIQAGDAQRFVLVHFWSETCEPCKRLERNVFNQSPFTNAMHANFVPVKINLSVLPELGRDFRITSVPTDIILTADGREVHRMISPQDLQQYITTLNQVSAHARLLQRVPVAMAGAPRQENPSTELPRRPEAVDNPYTANLPPNSRLAPQGGMANPGGGPANYGNQDGMPTNAPPQNLPGDPRLPGGMAAWPNSNQSGFGANSAPPTGFPPAPNFSTPDGGQYVENPYFRSDSPNPTATERAMASGPPASTSSPPSLGNPQAGFAGMPTSNGNLQDNPFFRAHEGGSTATNASVPAPGGAGLASPQSVAASSPATNPPTANLAGAAAAPGAAATGLAPNIHPTSPGAFPNSVNNFAPNNVAANHVVGGGQPAGPQATSMANSNAPATGRVNPQLGLDGFCPVSLVQNNAWVQGDVKWGAVHRGRTYLFATSEQQQQFLADPDRYGPMLLGFDPVAFAERRELVPGKREFGLAYHDRIYLFNDEQSLQRFHSTPETFAPMIEQAMRQGDESPTTWR